MSGTGKVVCVTGGSGYIASWLVKMLLEHGYIVKATVQNLNDPRNTLHLLALGGAKERLHLFEADLLEKGSFDSAVDGCNGVFHTASPLILSSTDPQADLIDPAVKGTLNVLQSCIKVPSIRRVVVTSSMTSVMVNRKPLKHDAIVDESWFSSPAMCEEMKLFYHLSKTLAEEAARKFAKENNVDLVTLHPGYVIGPMLQPILNVTSEGMLNLIKNGMPCDIYMIQYQIPCSFKFVFPQGPQLQFSLMDLYGTGKELFQDGIYRFVDVRDVAHAHVQAFEIPAASGRYCLVGNVTYSSQVFRILHELYPAISIPEIYKNGEPDAPPHHVSQERAKSLGINFFPLELSLKDTVESLRQRNLLAN